MGYSRPHDAQFWQERFGTPEGVEHWHFYAYEYLDDLAFMPSARETFGDWEDGERIIALVEEKFRQLRWDGDGEMQILWLPPFTGAGPHDFYGCYALHVKQNEDGISWIASPYVLPFHRLFQHDFMLYEKPGTGEWQQGSWRKGMIRWIDDL
ncbi:MAG: hypothetical protein ACYC6A_17280 [Armatimonadota bacterium]